jgi:fructose-1,6-bisphosphatase/inositol monophosphatase family enzyme
VIEGSVNAFVEIRIRLHDISPALPILINAGIKVLDLKGSNYANKQFNVSQAETQRYEEIASYSPDLPDQIVTLYQEAA